MSDYQSVATRLSVAAHRELDPARSDDHKEKA
jgi:hypothetical protein